MKFLKYLIFLVLALMLLYGVACFFGPKGFDSVRTIEIEAPKNMVYNMVNNLESWEMWSPWKKKDPDMALTYSDNTVGVGASYTWDSENKEVGAGSLEIIESVLGERIKTNIKFEDWDGSSNGNWGFSQNGKSTTASWGFESDADLPFLLRGFMLLTGAKGNNNKTMDGGLQAIKEIAEDRAKNKVYSGYKINELELPEKHFLMNRSVIAKDNMQQFYSSNLGALMGKVMGTGAEAAGMPCGLYFKWDEESNTADMAAAIPTSEILTIRNTTAYTIPAKNAIQVDYYGDYEKIADAHNAVLNYIKDFGLIYDLPVMEQYMTDPTEVKDPSKWLTQITYFLANQ